jgi:hypothetical protein
MKTILRSIYRKDFLYPVKSVLFLTGLLFFSQVSAQPIPLSFTGSPIMSGPDGAVGTSYTWNNVGTYSGNPIKAVITILNKSGSPLPTLQSGRIDDAIFGIPEAWQPIINVNTTPAGGCWQMDFDISFFDPVTNAPLVLPSIMASGVDIDGEGPGAGAMQEFNTFTSPYSYTIETPTSLTITSGGGVNKYVGVQYNVSGVAISATDIIATNNYVNVSSIKISLGGCCGSSSGGCSTGVDKRIHCIDFYHQIGYHNPKTIVVVLPLTLLEFNARKAAGSVVLGWKTASEENIDHFVLEKSQDGIHFESLTTMQPGPGSANSYTYTDNQLPDAAYTYYRLEWIERDGRSFYSQVLAVKSEGTEGQNVKVYSNPFSQSLLVQLNEAKKENIKLEIIDNSGRIIDHQERSVEAGTSNFLVKPQKQVASGVYYMRIQSPSFTSTQKIIL